MKAATGRRAARSGRAERARRAETRRLYRARTRRRRVVLAVTLLAVATAVAVALRPSGPPMTPLEARIVSYAESQLGYHTNPADSYCNKFSAYWQAGSTDCPSGESSEEWCADFAAWAWKKAGIPVSYGYGPDEINGSAASFYEWGVAHHRWHPARGYSAAPGDVAVYGLDLEGSDPSAAHVAIVTDDPPGQAGPDVVNGDGDRTGFSVVESGHDQVLADAGSDSSRLSGYVVPPPLPRRLKSSPR